MRCLVSELAQHFGCYQDRALPMLEAYQEGWRDHLRLAEQIRNTGLRPVIVEAERPE